MESEVNKKNNIGVTVIIVLLSVLVIMLGYYFVSHEFFNKNEEVKEIEKENTNNKETETTNNKETKTEEIDYSFNAEKIVNKDSSYTYTLGDASVNDNIISSTKTSTGYKFCSGSNCKEVTGEFSTKLGAIVFKGGPGMGDGYVFLVSKGGELSYVNESDTGTLKTGVISQINNVVKLYAVDLASDRTVSSTGSTVVAQTKDGSLYDLYEYVK